MGFAIDLVEGVSDATIKSLLTKLGRLLANEYALLRGVRGDIQYINDEMASMQAFLADLSAGPRDHDRRLKDWMKQIRDVSYDVEDCVDDFAHRLPHDTARGDIICCATVVSWVYDVGTWWPRRNIASTVTALKARTQQIGERRARYGVENLKSGDDVNSGGFAGFDAAENQQTSLQLVGTRMPVGVDTEMEKLGQWVSIIPGVMGDEPASSGNNILAEAHTSSDTSGAFAGGHWLTAPPSSKVRRLSLQQQHGGDSRGGNPVEGMNLSHVRSLTVSEGMGKLRLRSNSLKFGIVQVLDLDGCKDLKHHDAKEICKMRLLKYISLRRTDVSKLSKKIKNLQYLETLDVRETNVTELPKTICQLQRLVNILGGNKRTRKGLKLPEDLRNTMNGLRVLSGIEIVEEGANPVVDFHHLTDLRKLAIYKLNISKWDLFQNLSSSIEYLGGYSLHTLVIEDVSSGSFLESLGDLSSPPRFLTALELSGKLVKLPGWITELDALTKLTLSLTALSFDALVQISQLKTLFSLTFSLAAQKQDPETAAVVEENKAKSDGEIIFPAGKFENLKLLRFSAPFVPLLRFSRDAMQKLERLEARFSILEGLYGVENLSALKEVHLRVHDEACDFTKLMVEGIKTAKKGDGGPRVIIDHYHD